MGRLPAATTSKKLTDLQTVLVEVIRRAVAGGHEDEAVVEQVREQLLQDHGIGYVRHLERNICFKKIDITRGIKIVGNVPLSS